MFNNEDHNSHDPALLTLFVFIERAWAAEATCCAFKAAWDQTEALERILTVRTWWHKKKVCLFYSPAALILTKSAELEPECPENKNVSQSRKWNILIKNIKASVSLKFSQFWSACCRWAAGRCNCPPCCTAAGWPSGRWRPAVCTCKQQQQQQQPVQNETDSLHGLSLTATDTFQKKKKRPPNIWNPPRKQTGSRFII